MDNNEVISDGFTGIDGAAKFLDVNTGFVRTRCQNKWKGLRIPSYRIAGRLKFLRSDLVDWANFHKNEIQETTK
jgi:hypothetical protein